MKQLDLIAIQARRERLERLLHGLVELLTEDGQEFYTTELVNAWENSEDDESWSDRRYAFSVVNPFLQRLLAEDVLTSRLQETVGHFTRRYYSRSSSWRPSVPPEGWEG